MTRLRFLLLVLLCFAAPSHAQVLLLTGAGKGSPVAACHGSTSFTSTTTWTAPCTTSVVVETIGGGATAGGAASSQANGGGAGGYSKLNAFAATNAVIYTVTVGAAQIGTTLAGLNGNDTWFSTALTILAKGGSACDSTSVCPGGQASAGIGDTKFNGGDGGRSGNFGGLVAGGGGGAAGTSGAGNAGVNGNGGAGSGGATGGARNNAGIGVTGSDGSACEGGGGGGGGTTGGGSGGAPGAGSGGAFNSGNAGNSKAGKVCLTW